MGRQSIEGFSYQGALEDFDTLTKLANKRFTTVLPLGPNRAGLDVITNGLFVEGPADRVVEAGSTDSLVVLTGHGAYVGQVVRLKTTANTIRQKEVAIKEIVDANSFLLEGRLDADLTPGDTFDLLGGISQTFTSSGAPVSGPIQFTLDGVDVSVNEDTVTPANNRPLPVKLTDITGDINITAGDLNVQLTHTGATPDSVRIGDGVETVNINASNEMQVADDTARTSLASVDGKLNTLGQKAMAASMPVVIASDQSAINVNNIAGTISLPTGAATEATLSAAEVHLGNIETINTAMSAKLPNTLGQKTSALSLAVVIASDQSTLPISAVSLPLPTGAATETTLALLGGKDFATQTTLATLGTETTLAAMSAKLPAALGPQTSANSLSVTFASDQSLPTQRGRTAVARARLDYSVTNVTTGAYEQLIASVPAEANKMEIFDSSGQTLVIAFGPAAGEVDQFLVFPGGNGSVDINVPAATRVSIQAVSALADAGEISINFYS